MKIKRFLTLGFALLILLACLSACGGSGASQEQTTDEGNAAVSTLPNPDTSATADGLLGTWTQVDSSDHSATISKTDSGYQYKDNDGTYPATFSGGILQVEVGERDFASAYIIPATGHMLTVYQGDSTEFVKK